MVPGSGRRCCSRHDARADRRARPQFLNQPIQIRAEQGASTPPPTHRPVRLPRPRDGQARAARPGAAGQGPHPDLIFTRTKRTAAKVADDSHRGFAAAAIHGDLGQGAREQALRAFRSGKVDVLVATDVAARGLDVEGISHVVNYQAPEDEMTYVAPDRPHRAGPAPRATRSPRRLGRHAALEADLRQARTCRCTSRSRRTPPRRTCTSSWTSRPRRRVSCRGPSAPAPAWTPSNSRTSAAAHRSPPARGAGGSGGPSGSRSATPRADRPARKRSRTRTRGGQPVDGRHRPTAPVRRPRRADGRPPSRPAAGAGARPSPTGPAAE